MFFVQPEISLRTIILQCAGIEEGLHGLHSAIHRPDEGPSVESEQALPLKTMSGTVDMLNQLR